MLISSSELPEIVAVCDRAYVLRDKMVVGHLSMQPSLPRNASSNWPCTMPDAATTMPRSWVHSAASVAGVAYVLPLLLIGFAVAVPGFASAPNVINIGIQSADSAPAGAADDVRDHERGPRLVDGCRDRVLQRRARAAAGRMDTR